MRIDTRTRRNRFGVDLNHYLGATVVVTPALVGAIVFAVDGSFVLILV